MVAVLPKQVSAAALGPVAGASKARASRPATVRDVVRRMVLPWMDVQRMSMSNMSDVGAVAHDRSLV
jgi:hypothetical protein